MDSKSIKIEDAVNALIAIFVENSGITPQPCGTVGRDSTVDKTPSVVSTPRETPRATPRPDTSLESNTSLGDQLSEEEQWLKEECDELFNHFNHKCLEAILRATKLSLDLIRKRVFIAK